MAAQGAQYLIRSQPNARIEMVSAGIALGAGWWFRITSVEWAVLCLTVFLVLALEGINTAIETAVDLASPQLHPLAKLAKDVAGGAVMIAAVGSLAVALAIFGPRLWASLAQ
jgi:diacylglycerol kinase